MRKPQGYAVLIDGEGRSRERDTFTCGHCQRIVHVAPKADPAEVGGMCYGCGALVCPTCVEARACTPIKARLEAAERRADALRSYGL